MSQVRKEEPTTCHPHAIAFCERFLELVIDLLSTLPTRRYLLALVKDHCMLEFALKSSLAHMRRHVFEGTGDAAPIIFHAHLKTLEYYVFFEMDEVTGSALDYEAVGKLHYERLRVLQRIVFSFGGRHGVDCPAFAAVAVARRAPT